MAEAAPRAESDAQGRRGRVLGWTVTAAVLAAVTAAALLAAPSASSAPAAAEAKNLGPIAARRVPLDCGPVGVSVVKRITVDLDRDGRPDTVIAAHCDAGTGSPPDGIFLYTPAADAARRPVVLLDPKKGLTVRELEVRDGGLHARMLGYSSDDVPRCCPDRMGNVTWRWDSGIFRLTGQEPTGGLTVSV